MQSGRLVVMLMAGLAVLHPAAATPLTPQVICRGSAYGAHGEHVDVDLYVESGTVIGSSAAWTPSLDDPDYRITAHGPVTLDLWILFTEPSAQGIGKPHVLEAMATARSAARMRRIEAGKAILALDGITRAEAKIAANPLVQRMPGHWSGFAVLIDAEHNGDLFPRIDEAARMTLSVLDRRGKTIRSTPYFLLDRQARDLLFTDAWAAANALIDQPLSCTPTADSPAPPAIILDVP